MVETIIKRKIIKKRKKRAKKAKPTQEQKQTQIVNIYNSGKLRNPIGIKRQKQKDKISALENRRIYRPLAINQHVNSFEIEQRLYSKFADENRLNQIAQQKERERMERERTREQQILRQEQDLFQKNVFDYVKRKELDLSNKIRNQLDQAELNTFDNTPSKGYGDEQLDPIPEFNPKSAEEPDEPVSGSNPNITIAEPLEEGAGEAIPIAGGSIPAGIQEPSSPPPPEPELEEKIEKAEKLPVNITDKYNSLPEVQREILRKEMLTKYPNTRIFKGKDKRQLSAQSTIKSMITVNERNFFNSTYEKLITGTTKKKGRPKKEKSIKV